MKFRLGKRFLLSPPPPPPPPPVIPFFFALVPTFFYELVLKRLLCRLPLPLPLQFQSEFWDQSIFPHCLPNPILTEILGDNYLHKPTGWNKLKTTNLMRWTNRYKVYPNHLNRLKRTEKLHWHKSQPIFPEVSQTDGYKPFDFPTGISSFAV